MEEINNAQTKKKSNAGLVILIAILMIICLIGGYFISEKKLLNLIQETKEETTEKKKENISKIISNEELELMNKVSDVVFQVEKEALETKDLTDEQKIEIAGNLTSGYTSSTGTEMNEAFKKYFGNNQSLKFVDIKCDNDHGSEEANIMMKYDANQDKYVYNDNHPGHGGYGDFIGKKMVLDSIEKTEKGYNLVAKVLFYEGTIHDTGPTDYKSAYKSYVDAKEQKNELVKIYGNDNYKISWYEVPTYDIDKVLEDYKNQLDTYTFIFVKEDGRLIFNSYSIDVTPMKSIKKDS